MNNDRTKESTDAKIFGMTVMDTKAFVGVAVCGIMGIMLAGCMSLEERLASDDPNIKFPAERQLVINSRSGGTKEDRLAAIRRVTDMSLLLEIAQISKEQHGTLDDGLVAVERLNTDELLAEAAKSCESSKVRNAAFERIKNPAVKDATRKKIEEIAMKRNAAAWAAIVGLKYKKQGYSSTSEHVRYKDAKKLFSALSAIDLEKSDNAVRCVKELCFVTVDAGGSDGRDVRYDAALTQFLSKTLSQIKDPNHLKTLAVLFSDFSKRDQHPRVSMYETRRESRAGGRGGRSNVGGSNEGATSGGLVSQLANMLTESYASHDILKAVIQSESVCFIEETAAKEVLERMEDEKALADLVASGVGNSLRNEVYKKIHDPVLMRDLLLAAAKCDGNSFKGTASWGEVGMVYRLGKKEQACLAEVALKAKNSDIKECAFELLTDPKVMASLIEEGKITDEEMKIKLINRMPDGSATEKLYRSVCMRRTKEAVFLKLPESVRVEIRKEYRPQVEKMIADAKENGKGTFELGGFYLGMDIAEADKLVGYYFPEWANVEDVHKTTGIREFWIPQQSAPLCRAKKDGKVYELNFGKKFLKKWFKYDVQDSKEWAAAYASQHQIPMNYKLLEKKVSAAQYYMQSTWQYKNNAKDYRITYYGSREKFNGKDYGEPTANNLMGGFLSQAIDNAAFKDSIRFISADEGTLRVAVDDN